MLPLRKALALLAGSALLLLPTLGDAQDFPTFKGDNQRVSRNAAPNLNGPGRSFLRWWRPNNLDGGDRRTIVRNNTSATEVKYSGTWFDPAPLDEASFVFDPLPTGDTNEDKLVGTNPNPSYRYARTVASTGASDDPIAGATSWATFNLDPSQLGPFTGPRDYALYVWVPTGPTFEGGVAVFPQRYWVYEIQYGDGASSIEVIDTYQSGGGWVRLGNGGRATNALYQYTGSPIRITLYNTVPRNAGGGLMDTPGSTLVYADAVMAVPFFGYYSASPIVGQHDALGGGTTISTFAATNEVSTGTRDGQRVTITRGVLQAFDHDTGARLWNFAPVDESEFTASQDNSSAGVTPGAGWVPSTTASNFQGTDYLSAPITSVAASATDVRYEPSLEPGSYRVLVWLPGDSNGIQFGQSVAYEIRRGNVVVETVLVDQSLNRGWVALGTTRHPHTGADPLTVRITNLGGAADVGKQSYADSVRFVGASNLAIHSTPVLTRAFVRLAPNAAPVERDVVIVAAENGRIYCLTAEGNADGTGTVLWTYPSTPDTSDANWSDPNHVAGIDGEDGIAEMPTAFDINSALVQRINGADYLFIASRNGRIYSIEMAGRGDMQIGLRRPGTTTRAWSYPDDYPASRRTSNLGAVVSSLSYSVTTDGPTIFAATPQGRMFALDAAGQANRTTNVRWTFPNLNQPAIGPIQGTPSIEFGRIYFGTLANDNATDPDLERGWFYALDVNTGAMQWSFSPADADDFVASPATVPGTELAGGMPDTVFVANENKAVYALDAATGAQLWVSNDLLIGVHGAITYTPLTVLMNDGLTFTTVPTIVVPTTDGRFTALFARTGELNRFGTRRAWEFNTAGDYNLASLAVGRSWMYGADNRGYLYAFNNIPGVIDPGFGVPPGDETIVENDPAGDAYRTAKVKFINRDMYYRLRLPDYPTADPNLPTYSEATAAAAELARNPKVFDWGETIYLMAYDFMYDRTTGGQVPLVHFRFSSNGREQTVPAKLFRTASVGSPNSGYAVYAFSVQGGGSNAMAPGPGTISVRMSAPGTTTGTRPVALDPATSSLTYSIANPLGIRVYYQGATSPLRSLGYDPMPTNPENLVNGSPDLQATVGKRENMLMSSTDLMAHGQQGTAYVEVVDRSLVTLIRGPGRGLDNVRVNRRDLAWQNGPNAILKRIDPALFPSFEDLPQTFPNNSLDYPDIRAEAIKVTKDPLGLPENPVFNGVSLKPPTSINESVDPPSRILDPTRFDFEVQVPRYQPANVTNTIADSAGASPFSGYLGRVQVYVDSSGNGLLDRNGATPREAFRSIWLAGGVQLDEKIVVSTPTVDLGSLAIGAGFTPLGPLDAAWPYSPWPATGNPFANVFKPFQAFNEGNANLLNVRLAKSTLENGVFLPWPIYSQNTHEMAWLDGTWNMWSDIDERFAPTNPYNPSVNAVLVQKARAGDRSGTELYTNPLRRPNPNLGVDAPSALIPGLQTGLQPRVSVTIPPGMPVGTYSQMIRVIEDWVNGVASPANLNGDESLPIDANRQAGEPVSEPGMTLKFNVRETRLTNTSSLLSNLSPLGVGPMLDDLIVGGSNTNFLHQNAQPAAFRDAVSRSVVVAFSTNRDNWTEPQPTQVKLLPNWRIYLGSMDWGRSSNGGSSPLADLNVFNPANTSRWFRHEVQGFPTTPLNTLFPTAPGETILNDTAAFGAPTFPAAGATPFGGTTQGRYMGFIGTVQKQVAANGQRIAENRLFISMVTVGQDGAISMGAPIEVGRDVGGTVSRVDPLAAKSSLAVIQNQNFVTVLYTLGGTGQSQINYTSFNGTTWTTPRPLLVGSGVEAASQPAGFARFEVGRSGAPVDLVVDVTFSAKLKGRASSEIYFGQMNVAGGVAANVRYLTGQTQEDLLNSGNGQYQAMGIMWNTRDTIRLEQLLPNGTVVDLEVAGTRSVDRSSGFISFDTKLGGRVYLDPSQGTVRFSSSTPPAASRLLLTYTPAYLRVSAGTGAAYGGSTILYDDRRVGATAILPDELISWRRPNNTPAQLGDVIRRGRFVFFYSRGASGTGQTARPYVKTMRFGIQLPFPIHMQPNGQPTGLTVAGATQAYQIDPANGRIYFQTGNEGANVSVTYQPVDQTNGQPLAAITVAGRARMIVERGETPVPIEQAVNESTLTAFLDPVQGGNTSNGIGPNLMWLFWTSTRGGSPDLYFQGYAPRITPVPVSR